MNFDAIIGDSISHAALRASTFANEYFKAMNERAHLVTGAGALAPAFKPFMFNYFGVQVEIKEGIAPAAIAEAIVAKHGQRFMEYQKHLTRNAKVELFESTAGTSILESAWEATQRAQAEVNQMLDRGEPLNLKRYAFAFNGAVAPFNPYSAGHELAEQAMNEFQAQQLERENSPEGQVAKEKQERREAQAKAKLESFRKTLPTVLKMPLDDVLRWIEGFSKAYNTNQREAKAGWVVDSFNLEDYFADVYVGEAALPYILSDKSVLGAYIVGQFLATLRDGRQIPDALEVLLGQYRAQP
jgi:hypothetical protein